MHQYKFILGILLASIFSGVFTLGGYLMLQKEEVKESISNKQHVVLSNYKNDLDKTSESNYENYVPQGLNFTVASQKVIPAVVHIKTRYNGKSAYNDLIDGMKDFFGDGDFNPHDPNAKLSSGSGVIISSDGYIATNNHVIESADAIEVVLDDKRSYRAVLVGSDPTTDLALLRINAHDLPFVPYGNSDNVIPGEWVLAIGNPFDLTSTVTAGIVSAKARNIGIIKSRNSPSLNIESFIQTDAAVNPGNSGGALVDLEGNLIGINTAIATRTGYYAGYSFAVPVALVRKIMDDLLEFGEVQRALMGVNIRDVDASIADLYGLDKVEGVYIDNVQLGGGADDAGISPGDVILKINGLQVDNSSELQELVARNRPGDIIKVVYKRSNQVKEAEVQLKNVNNTTDVVRQVKTRIVTIDQLGAEVTAISDRDKKMLSIESGLKIIRITEGKLRDARLEEGFVMTHIDEIPLNSPEDLIEAITNTNKELLIEGTYPDGQKVFYQLDLEKEVIDSDEEM